MRVRAAKKARGVNSGAALSIRADGVSSSDSDSDDDSDQRIVWQE